MTSLNDFLRALNASLNGQNGGGGDSPFRVYARVGGIDIPLGLPPGDDGRKRAADGSMHTAGCAELDHTAEDTSDRPNSRYKADWQREETRHQCWTRDPLPPWVPLIPATEGESADNQSTLEANESKISRSDLTVNGYPMMYIHINDEGTEVQAIIGVASDRTYPKYCSRAKGDRNKVREYLDSNGDEIPPDVRRMMADTVRWYDKAKNFSSLTNPMQVGEDAARGEILAKLIVGSMETLPRAKAAEEEFPIMDRWAVPHQSLELLTRRSIGDDEDYSSWTEIREQEQRREVENDRRSLKAEIKPILYRIKPSSTNAQESYIVIEGRHRYQETKELNGSISLRHLGANMLGWYARTADPGTVQPIPSEIFTTEQIYAPSVSEKLSQATEASQAFIRDVVDVRYGNVNLTDWAAVAKIGGRERLGRITRISRRGSRYGYVWESRDDYIEAFLAAGVRMGIEGLGLQDEIKVARKRLCSHATINGHGFFDEESLQKATLSEAEYDDLKAEIEYHTLKEQSTRCSVM